MRKLWLIFAQTATLSLAVLFVVSTLRPDLLSWTGNGRAGNVVLFKEAPAADPASPQKVITTFSGAVTKAMPSVVNIFTTTAVKQPENPLMNDPLFRHFFGDRPEMNQKRASLGSGVIVSPQGLILTNHHVVASGDEIEVALSDGRKAQARIVGSDPETDLAVLQLDIADLPAITFGQSERAGVGDVVLAIGNPFGVGQTVTMGIVSALRRDHLGINTFENFIQTDAAINPGNSGGALIDISGNLIGINTAIFSQTGGSLGIGFAIPVSLARQVMEQIVETGGVTRGWIGVEAQELTADLAESFKLPNTDGVLISGVLRGGPADKAGVKPGDILISVDGKSVTDSTSMLNLIAVLQPGAKATVEIARERNRKTVQVEVGKRPQQVSRRPESRPPE
ncbi:MAG: Do family serine endopeptidase [Burkholderiales bacterium]|nr:Do family serine endopeptidase [Burkholderiales bacterium]